MLMKMCKKKIIIIVGFLNVNATFRYRYERHLVFPKLFASKCSDFSNENMIFNADDRKGGSARRYLCNRLSDNVNVYTLEVSMNGFFIKGTNVITPYTEADCKMMMRLNPFSQ